MDVRARSLLPDLERAIGSERFHEMTGKPVSGNLTVLKIYWLRQNEPEIYGNTSKFLDVAAYLNYQLTDSWGTGWGIADPTGMFDMRRNCWSEEVLDFMGLDQSHMPTCLQAGKLIGSVSTKAGRECNLPPGLPVVAGIGDGQAGGVGLNINTPGGCYLSLGTSVVSGTFTDQYIIDQTFRTMLAGVPGGYSFETVILGGTYTIDWFREHFGREFSLQELENKIRNFPPGSEGLVLVPYWNSVLNPYWDPTASGMVLGWRGHHTPNHLYRAILEGIAYELRRHFEGIQSALGKEISKLVVMGGGSESALWCQIISDITGHTLHRTNTSEATALGAGVIAAYGTGLFDDLHTAADQMTGGLRDHFQPDPNNHRQYSRLYQDVYKDLFLAIQPFSQRLAEITTPE
jgi:xylulokinase